MAPSAPDFYTALAGQYDELFGCSEQLTGFLVGEGAAPGTRVLDVASGTGACTRSLLARGVDCYATDLSSRMIERARSLARAHGIDTSRFAIADMRETHRHRAAPFDLVFCMGNSVSHLASLDEVEGADHLQTLLQARGDAVRAIGDEAGD